MFFKIGIALLSFLFATNIIYAKAGVSFDPVELKFSSYVWEPGQEIEATVTTSIFKLERYPISFTFVLDMFSNEERKPKFWPGLPKIKYHHEGKLNLTSYSRLLAGNHGLKFEVKNHLKDGDYTIVLLVLANHENGFDDILSQSIATVRVQRKPETIASPTILQVPEMNFADITERISKIESVVDLCDFCSTSSAACDRLFRTDFPKHLQLPPQLPEFGGLEDQSPLTTTEVCKFSEIHKDLRRYRFKYFDKIPSDKLDPFPRHPIKLINQYVLARQKIFLQKNAADNGSQNGHSSSQVIEQSTVLAWSHPNILALLKVFYTAIFKHVGLLFDRAFSPWLHHELNIETVLSDLSWDGVLARMNDLKTVHQSMEFKKVLARYSPAIGGHRRLSLGKGAIFGSTILLLYKSAAIDYTSQLRTWLEYGEEQKIIKIIDRFIEW